MSELAYTVTIDGENWSESQLRRVEYDRTLHVLHELKALGVQLKDGDRELSHLDLNWLDPERAEQISLEARSDLGEDGFLEVYKDVLADSEARWRGWAADYDPSNLHTAEIVIEATGVEFQETMAIIGGAASQYDALATNPEHFIIIGDIESGQRGAETFGMFGGPVYMHGVAHDTVPDYLADKRDESYPVAVFGEMAFKSDDTNFHVGALHQFRPSDNRVEVKSIFIAPGSSPRAIADGHKLHFALEVVNSMKIAYAKRQADAAEEAALMDPEAGTGAATGTVDGTWNVEARGRQGVITLHTDGSTLTGGVDVVGINAEIQDGRVNGANFTGAIEADGPVGHVKAKLAGTVDGDALSGTLKVGIVKTKLTGTRA
ncbi:hypothetical protein NQ038_05510 [Brevibacterium sp. 50QC2O2]|uniref:hypothetical protein n=1 Tax=Brevibacterium sp. 50QC2O2 TaxID=2968459 RepID=UPI00211C1ABB|nr:hypothetical protein [Brevibacterium sp. 50QC2O2]MCQ9388103.1 hypothetical protein [Brevibacterium sp. 50QC2O2]